MSYETSIQELDNLKQQCSTLVETYKTTLHIPKDIPTEDIANDIHTLLLDKLADQNISIKTEKTTEFLYGTYYISSVDYTCDIHRSKYIIHRPHMFYLAEFATKKQLDAFAEMLGFSYREINAYPIKGNAGNIRREYKIDKELHDCILFRDKSEIPENAKPFKALSNGHIVTCYFTSNDTDIYIYRPNPNSKDVYDPLSQKEQSRYVDQHGLY